MAIVTKDVNAVLRVMGYAKVNTVDATPDSDEAYAVLDEQHNELMEQDWWFNTELNYLLSADDDGKIALPNDTMRIMINGTNRYIMRDGSLYDAVEHTFVIDMDINVGRLTLLIDPADCPGEYRKWWLAESKLQYALDNNAESQKIRALSSKQQLAMVQFKQQHLQMSKVSALNGAFAQKLVRGMGASTTNGIFGETYAGGYYAT